MAIELMEQIRTGFGKMLIPVNYVDKDGNRMPLGEVIWAWYTPDEAGYKAFLAAKEVISYQDFINVWRQRKTDARNEFASSEKAKQGITESSSPLVNKKVYEALTSKNKELVKATTAYLRAQDPTLDISALITAFEDKMKRKKRVKKVIKVTTTKLRKAAGS